MKISGVFVVEEDCIVTLYAMQESRRLDYLLGLNKEHSFEKHIVAMDSYVETPVGFYKTFIRNILVSKILIGEEMDCVYRKDQHMIYILEPHNWSLLCKELKQIENIEERLTKYFNEPLNGKLLESVSLKEKAKGFIDLIKTEHKKSRYIIMVFQNHI